MAEGPTRRRRVVAGATKRVVAGAQTRDRTCDLEDVPLELQCSRDGKWLLATLPHEIAIIHRENLRLERSIELDAHAQRPSVSEGPKGELWIGGRHLHRCELFAGKPTKVGSKLAGYVDKIALVRPDLLCGVGSRGEMLWSTSESKCEYQRQETRRVEPQLAVLPDERAAFCSGESRAWLLDPNYTSGYTKLGFRTSEGDEASPPIERLGLSLDGRCLLGARDGAVAWTTASGTIEDQVYVPPVSSPTTSSTVLSLAGDSHWIYVLRPSGRLLRFPTVKASPNEADPKRRDGHGRRGGSARAAPNSNFAPATPQECRLARQAVCMVLALDTKAAQDEAHPTTSNRDKPAPAPHELRSQQHLLYFASPRAEGMLGSIWSSRASDLDWTPLKIQPRPAWVPPAAPPELEAFVATRSKLPGKKIRDISVDEVLAGNPALRLTHGNNDPLDWATHSGGDALNKIMAGDGLLIAACVRFAQGTVRPAMLLCPSRVHADGEPPPSPRWLVWGDEPRGWMLLDTPNIRRQRWQRSELFPMIAALASAAPKQLPGVRGRIAKTWIDPELFASMAKECKTRMEVLW